MSQVEQSQGPVEGAHGDATMDAAIQEEIKRLTDDDGSDNAPGDGQAEPDNQDGGEDANADGADGNEADADAQGDAATAEIEFNGKTYEVPEELKEGFMLKADYTRKTTEVAQRREAVEQAEQQLASLFQPAQHVAQFDAALGNISGQINEIQQYLASNPTLVHDRPADYAKLTGKLTELNYQGQTIFAKRNETQQQFDQFQSQQTARRVQDAEAWLSTNAKFTPQERKATSEYAVKSGYLSPEAMQFLHQGGSPGALVLLDKARRYDELMAKKPGVQQKVTTKIRAMSPGSSASQGQRTGSVEAQTKRLKSSGSVNDAVALELERMRGPRRR